MSMRSTWIYCAGFMLCFQWPWVAGVFLMLAAFSE